VRFLTYLRRAAKVHRNFVLITHADCLGATLGLLPSHAGQTIASVEYCGMVLASRRTPSRGMCSKFSAAAASAVAWRQGTSSKTEAAQPTAEEEVFVDLDNAVPKESRLVKKSEGWTVKLFSMTTQQVTVDEQAFQKRVRSLAKKGPWSRGQIEQILSSSLPVKPLSCEEGSQDHSSHASCSTLAFGQSQASMEDSDRLLTQAAPRENRGQKRNEVVGLIQKQMNGIIREGNGSSRPIVSGMEATPHPPSKGMVLMNMNLNKSSMLQRRSV